jgi:XisH protein
MAKDIYHTTVRHALEKDGWTITHDPYIIKKTVLGAKLEIDLGLEKVLTAEKGTDKIAVEVKSFVQISLIHEFHSVVGQYLNYLVGLEQVEPDRVLYLAIPELVYKSLIEMELFTLVSARIGIKIIVFDKDNECIILWKK